MENLFTYGTLMCEEIIEAVCGYRMPRVGGVLEGFRRRAVKGELYPGIHARAGESTRGQVYLGVPDTAWGSLDEYEGEMYRRVKVEVHAGAGQPLDAWAYVLRPQYRHRLAEHDWDFSDFLRNGKAAYLKALVDGA